MWLLEAPPPTLICVFLLHELQGLADGLHLLTRAYVLDPANVGVLVMLAHCCLIKGEHDKV